MPKIAAFDLATCTGFCIGEGASLPRVGHIKVASPAATSLGQSMTEFRRALIELLAEEKPDLIVGEAPIIPKPFFKDGKLIQPTRIEVTTMLQGLWAHLNQVAFAKGIEFMPVTIQTVKKELAGVGDAKKDAMVAAAEKVGLTIEVHDEADAFGAWLVGVRLRCHRDLSMAWDRRIWSSRGALL